MSSTEMLPSGVTNVPSRSLVLGLRTFDLVFGVFLFVLMTAMESPMQDGDGTSIADRAINSGFLEGMIPNHALFAAGLRFLFLILKQAGRPEWTVPAFLSIMHLCSIGIYWILARSIYPRLMEGPILPRICAAGTVLSDGVLSRSVALEHYAPALLADLIAVAILLNMRPGSIRGGAASGIAFVLAVGIHITNLLIGPFLVVLIWARRGSKFRTLTAFFLATLIGGMIVMGMVHQGKTGRLFPFNLAVIKPVPDPEPALSSTGRVARGIYGFARSIAYLPFIREVSKKFLAAYALLGIGLILLSAVSARRHKANWRRRGGLLGLLLIFILPFAAMGFRYFPSDPERWLFLTPVVWLVIGWIVGDQLETSRRPRAVIFALGSAVVALGAYNSLTDVLPTRVDNKEYQILMTLAEAAKPEDLIITGGGIHREFLRDYFLGASIEGENLSLFDLAKRHGKDHAALIADLRRRVRDRLRAGGRVLVPGFFDESPHMGEGYPWAAIVEWDVGPETIREAFQPFHAVVLVPGRGRVPAIHSLEENL